MYSGEDGSTYTYLAYLGSIYVGPYNHVIWYLWYFENSSLVNPMVYISVVNTIYTQPDPEVSMDRPVHGWTWTDMDMDGRTDVHGLL